MSLLRASDWVYVQLASGRVRDMQESLDQFQDAVRSDIGLYAMIL